MGTIVESREVGVVGAREYAA